MSLEMKIRNNFHNSLTKKTRITVGGVTYRDERCGKHT